MFKVGKTVVYGIQGVCEITAVEKMKMVKTAEEYYVLTPVYINNNNIFVPVKNTELVGRMYDVLSKDEINEVIKFLRSGKTVKCQNFEKRTLFRETLSGNDRLAIARVINSLVLEQRERREQTKNLPSSDENLLNKARALLFGEIAFVMNISPDDVANMIKNGQ